MHINASGNFRRFCGFGKRQSVFPVWFSLLVGDF